VSLSERPTETNPAYSTATSPEPIRSLDDLPVRRYSSRQKKGCLNFPYVLVARIELDQPEMGDVRDRAIDYRAVIATLAIEVMVEAAVNRAARQYRNRENSNDTHCHSDARRNER
jgi:hypothetical protein